MTKDDIIKLARETNCEETFGTDTFLCTVTDLERFAKQVVANINPKSFMSWQEGYEAGVVAERERIIAKNVSEIEKINTHIKALEEALLAEREACAKVCETHAAANTSWTKAVVKDCAAAVRARTTP